MITTPRQPSPLDDFLLDLNGYLILKNAVAADLLAALNQAVDQLPPIEMGGWLGNAQRRDYTKDTGGHHAAHSGGHLGALRGAYRYANGVFRCGQCNIILALTDVGPGDGPTMIVPGSHKSNFPHPNIGDYSRGDRMDKLEGAVELHLAKGDALLFVDGVIHGGSSRTNPGERRVTIYRYGPLWGSTRYGFEYSQALLDRLTPERRKILQPVSPLRPPKQ